MTTIEPYRSLPPLHEGVRYEHGPLSSPGRHRPGDVRSLELTDSRHFPGTTRREWVHTPAGHDFTTPAAVMVLNDGWLYLDPDGDVRGERFVPRAVDYLMFALPALTTAFAVRLARALSITRRGDRVAKG